MRAELEFINGPFQGRKLALVSPLRMTFGRTGNADYSVADDHQMSSLHFELQLTEDSAIVRDLASTNGTFVDQVRVDECRLGDGVVIRAGVSSIRVHTYGAKPVAPAPQNDESSTAVPGPIAEAPEPIAEDLGAGAQTNNSAEESSAENAKLDPQGQGEPQTTHLVEPSPSASENASNMQSHRSSSPPLEESSSVFDSALSSPIESAGESRVHFGRGLIASGLPYEEAFVDEDTGVVTAALEAAAWSREPWLLDYCRDRIRGLDKASVPFLKMLAILAEPDELKLIAGASRRSEFGPERMLAIGLFGHPALLPTLVENFGNSDNAVAVAAGKAFQKIVGGDFESGERVTIPPQDGSEPDEFEQEFLEVEKLADRPKAEKYLAQKKDELAKSPRWSRGICTQRPISLATLARLDLESRWEVALRGVYFGDIQLSPSSLLKFRPISGLPPRTP